MQMDDSPLMRLTRERESLEKEVTRLQITLAQCAGHITLEQMHRLGVTLETAVNITDRASLEALARLAMRDASS